jgi:hypothetical protein
MPVNPFGEHSKGYARPSRTLRRSCCQYIWRASGARPGAAPCPARWRPARRGFRSPCVRRAHGDRPGGESARYPPCPGSRSVVRSPRGDERRPASATRERPGSAQVAQAARKRTARVSGSASPRGRPGSGTPHPGPSGSRVPSRPTRASPSPGRHPAQPHRRSGAASRPPLQCIRRAVAKESRICSLPAYSLPPVLALATQATWLDSRSTRLVSKERRGARRCYGRVPRASASARL